VNVLLAKHVSQVTYFWKPTLPPMHALAQELDGVEVHLVAWTGLCVGWKSKAAEIAPATVAQRQAVTHIMGEDPNNSPGTTITKHSAIITVAMTH
jgi:hypothetical protein